MDKAGCSDSRIDLTLLSLTEEGYIEIPIDRFTRRRERRRFRQSVRVGHGLWRSAFPRKDKRSFPLMSMMNLSIRLSFGMTHALPSRRIACVSSLQSANLHEAMPVVAPIATAPKIMWLREHFPELMAQAKRYLLLPDYLAYRLTGRAVTDPSTASSTGLYAQDAADYCAGALAAAGICKGALAEIQKPGQPIARVLPKSAEQWGLDAETLVVTGTNDQYAGALGAGNCRTGHRIGDDRDLP